MPLIDLITNLKSLTYGEFGSSEPLVIKDINKNPSLNGIELQGAKRIDDLTRISKLLTQTPAALKFASNQTALGIVEQGIKNPDGKFGKKLLGGAVGAATKLASTLAQVPVSGVPAVPQLTEEQIWQMKGVFTAEEIGRRDNFLPWSEFPAYRLHTKP